MFIGYYNNTDDYEGLIGGGQFKNIL